MNPEYENRSIRVPLALDAEIKMPIGPFRPSIRTAVLMAAVLPLCYLVYLLGFVSLGSRMAICAALVWSAAGGGALRREGIWLGLHAMYAKVSQ